MDIKTVASPLARSRQAQRLDPATVWSPLSALADAAAATVTPGNAVAITRGFDRKTRQRAKALNELLDGRGVPAIEVTPAPGSARLLANTEISAVVNLVGAGSLQPHRLAASLRAPMFVAESDEAEAKSDVIAMAAPDHGARDVALSRVEVRPEVPGAGAMTITRDDEPLSITGGQITIELHDQQLSIRLQGTDFAVQEFTATEISIETLDAPHRLLRDELPIAEFEGALTFSVDPAALVVHTL